MDELFKYTALKTGDSRLRGVDLISHMLQRTGAQNLACGHWMFFLRCAGVRTSTSLKGRSDPWCVQLAALTPG